VYFSPSVPRNDGFAAIPRKKRDLLGPHQARYNSDYQSALGPLTKGPAHDQRRLGPTRAGARLGNRRLL